MEEYSQWSHDELVKRIMSLESQLHAQTELLRNRPPSESAVPPLPKKPKQRKSFDPSRYSTHLIALKFAYLGGKYQGFEYHANNPDPNVLPTIEEELWRAMMKARLIFPTETPHSQPASGREHWEGPVNWTGLEYSKCGRTDRGVSAFGQVVVLRARSNKPLAKTITTTILPTSGDTGGFKHAIGDENDVATANVNAELETPFDAVKDEINYPAVLNRLLPPDIRILGWAPAPSPSFNARFSCRERRYRYFFTQPAFLPTPDASTVSSFLDIDAMREAASYLVGTHDFRNLCKIDVSKQMTNFTRRVTHASITEVSEVDMPSAIDYPTSDRSGCKLFALKLHGSAFLWHQVRCIVAILFLVGQGLEKPTVIRDILDMGPDGAGASGRPRYEMADDKPLVLWDCIYPTDNNDQVPPVGWEPVDHNGNVFEMEDSIKWITPGEQDSREMAVWGQKGMLNHLWAQWRCRKIEELLAASMFDQAAAFCHRKSWGKMLTESTLVFAGGNQSRPVGKYVALLERARQESPEVLNARYAAKKGLAVENVADVDVEE